MNSTEGNLLQPDYVFEVSWEVANKVGGIHTVISSKSPSMRERWEDRYICIGPDVWKGKGGNPEFEEDEDLFLSWKEQVQHENLRIKTGRWKFGSGSPVILVDFTPYYPEKDKIFTDFWDQYSLNSLAGGWDYIEPALFGYTAGLVIESFCRFYLTLKDRVIAHFHEWMTGTGILYLKDKAPQISTVFTTHATVMGRTIAGNGLPLYRELKNFPVDQLAQEFHVTAKLSLERRAAENADAFTTVSDITARECSQFLGVEPDVVTPNGISSHILPPDADFKKRRTEAREKLIQVARVMTGEKIPENSLLVAKSGRYEFRNKGMDVFLHGLGKLNQDSQLNRTVIAFIMVPANQTGPQLDLLKSLQGEEVLNDRPRWLTHNLQGIDADPIMAAIKENRLDNSSSSRVKAIFVPTYLNGSDGIFDALYYDLLIGFDITVFPSYYEPWGYTPVESLVFHIPTITTDVSGFGNWIKQQQEDVNQGIFILERTDDNNGEVATQLASILLQYALKKEGDVMQAREAAFALSGRVHWKQLFNFYDKAYDIAVRKAGERSHLFRDKGRAHYIEARYPSPSQRTVPRWRQILVESGIPEVLQPLHELSKNLWWSWQQEGESLFKSIDPDLWIACRRNPVVFLDRLPYPKLKSLENDPEFINNLTQLHNRFRAAIDGEPKPGRPKIGYFCMEYGLHPAIRIYSGGMGILAGDYLKEASDRGLDMVAVGLLYRQGYFRQSLSLTGDQLVEYKSQHFALLPLHPVRIEGEEWLKVDIPFPGRHVQAKIWRIDVGRVPLYLLDTDLEQNSPEDRAITYQLYGGDEQHRLKQEIFLGIGGVRLLKQLNIQPDIYHCNEGHAAFMGLERIRNLIENQNLSYQEALEMVRSSTLFTTHTPVPAGHDSFSEDLIRTYFSDYTTAFNIDWSEIIGLGRSDPARLSENFSMSYLAIRLAHSVNGVSKLHGEVSRSMFRTLWPAYLPEELHIDHITNGVHFSTWTAPEWQGYFDEILGSGFQDDIEKWKKIYNVSDSEIWSIRKQLKDRMIKGLQTKIRTDLTSIQENPKKILEVVNSLSPDALVIGFARRFATYKRAHLLFDNLDRLREIVDSEDRPVIFLFAGKAHPKDVAGQELIKKISETSRLVEFSGKVIFLQNYEMDLARQLVQGVDVWLNTPIRLMEASGTSGMKATLNGVLNLSVRDGWWAEGYHPEGGWGLSLDPTYDSRDFQDELDAETLYQLLQTEVIPKFYQRNEEGVPVLWVQMIKTALAEIAPCFTMRRMMGEYDEKYYEPIFKRVKSLISDNHRALRELTLWKNRMKSRWDDIKILDVKYARSDPQVMDLGEDFSAEIAISLGGLEPEEVGIEVIFSRHHNNRNVPVLVHKKELKIKDSNTRRTIYYCNFPVNKSGVYEFGFRIFPKHPLLEKQMHLDLVKWI